MTLPNERVQSLYIDADTMDFVYEEGDLKTDSTIRSNVLHQLALRKGSSASNPDGGNDVFNIRKALAVVPDQAKTYCRDALKQWIDEGRIGNVVVDAEIQHGWILAWEVGYEDQSGERIHLTLDTSHAVP